MQNAWQTGRLHGTRCLPKHGSSALKRDMPKTNAFCLLVAAGLILAAMGSDLAYAACTQQDATGKANQLSQLVQAKMASDPSQGQSAAVVRKKLRRPSASRKNAPQSNREFFPTACMVVSNPIGAIMREGRRITAGQLEHLAVLKAGVRRTGRHRCCSQAGGHSAPHVDRRDGVSLECEAGNCLIAEGPASSNDVPAGDDGRGEFAALGVQARQRLPE